MSSSPSLGFPFIAESQVQPEVTHNESLLMLTALLKGVVSMGLNSPPAGVVGNSYVVGGSPTGLWLGHANAVAIYTSGGWRFVPGVDDSAAIIPMGAAQEGMRIWDNTTNDLYIWNGSAWTTYVVTGYVESVVAGDDISVDSTDPANPVVSFDGNVGVLSVTAGSGIDVNATDPANIVITATGILTVTNISTASETLDDTLLNQWLRFTYSAGAKTLIVDTNATFPIPVDSQIHIRNAAAELLTIDPEVGVTINAPFEGTLVLDEGMSATLIKVGTDEFDLVGYTVAA